jgi:hypothetical protein
LVILRETPEIALLHLDQIIYRSHADVHHFYYVETTDAVWIDIRDLSLVPRGRNKMGLEATRSIMEGGGMK